jgi:hypothetical protein
MNPLRVFFSNHETLVYTGQSVHIQRRFLMKTIISLLIMLGFVATAMAQQTGGDTLDYGDHTSVTLMVKAWDALGAGEYADAVAYTEKCSELYDIVGKSAEG